MIHEHEIQLEGQQGTHSLSYESLVHPTDTAIAAVISPGAFNNEVTSAAAIEATVADREQASQALRKRIAFVLKLTTGFESPDDPQLWMRQYAEHYGWGAPEKTGTEVKEHLWQYATYFPIPAPKQTQSRSPSTSRSSEPLTAAPAPPASGPSPGADSLGMPSTSRGFVFLPRGECFHAGTPVLTLTGPQPIESIRSGDRVLAQDVITGELAYKTVQNRTLRRTVKLTQVHFGSQSISATPGHPFWVAGKGWQVAKHLKVGDRLCGLGPTVTVEHLENLPAQEVYNLVVSDFGTFFVGGQRLLVHDDTPLEATATLVPGLAVESTSDATQGLPPATPN